MMLEEIKELTITEFNGIMKEYPDLITNIKISRGAVKHFHIRKNLESLSISTYDNMTADPESNLTTLFISQAKHIPDLPNLKSLIINRVIREFIIPPSLIELNIKVFRLYVSKINNLESLTIRKCFMFPESLPELRYLNIEHIGKIELPYMPKLKYINCVVYNLRYVPKGVKLFVICARLLKSSKNIVLMKGKVSSIKDGSYSNISNKNKYLIFLIKKKVF